MRNARVFISCGQRTKTEVNIGRSVEDYFRGRGFETYFAERVHSSEALTENIFRFLRQSEYFVFIDFKRELISKGKFRGSLFVNQEIAIATFLKLEGIGFYQKGTKREGILNYHIYNARSFEDVAEIIQVLEEETKGWDVSSVNELKITYGPMHRGMRLRNLPGQPLSDWCHLDIRNLNKSKHAFSCLGYITRIRDLKTNKERWIPTNELVWSGTGSITTNIMAGSKRELDAFYVIYDDKWIRFSQRPLTTSSPDYRLPDLPRGKYLLEYTIVSDNFDTVSQNYVVEFEGSVKDIIFAEAD